MSKSHKFTFFSNVNLKREKHNMANPLLPNKLYHTGRQRL